MSSCHCSSPSSLMYLNFSHHSRFRRPFTTSARRHHRRRLLKYSPHIPNPIRIPAIFRLSDDSLQITLKNPSDSIQHLETRLNRFLDYGREALEELKSVVTVNEESGGVIISCKKSTVELLLALFLSSLVIVIAFRGLFKIRKNVGEVVVYKRDRSLGGKEVVVGKRETDFESSRKLTTPLSSISDSNYYQKRGNRTRSRERRRKQELPQWWPQVVIWDSPETTNKEEYQRMVNQLIQAIMDRKMNGEDISASVIVQLRHICKTYGVRAFINTENTRDSLYRLTINFVLSYCESISNLSTSIQINGEDAREFIAGLADNIGLESSRAATMVSAAVAARTRSKILQAWALEVQNKHSEALVELFKVCLIHRIFPPEESSPEMEMVAQGLEKSLNVEQRESLLNSFFAVCGKDIEPSVVEALGLNNGHLIEQVTTTD
ncbi:hypothetical protein ACJIZ3_018030 [Penstemon smallii]|uniref:Uncharacterized protein n=1 Tax=Penstemon smallii TaxID=265156 RepID=A0ABD3SYD2_9LAMI